MDLKFGTDCRGVYLPGVYLLGGVPAWGVYLPRGCTCLGGAPAQGVYLPGGVPAWGVYLPGGTCLGVYLPGGVPAWECTCPGGVPAQGVYLPGGCTCPGVVPAQGCTCLGGVPAGGMYLPRGVPAQGVYHVTYPIMPPHQLRPTNSAAAYVVLVGHVTCKVFWDTPPPP